MTLQHKHISKILVVFMLCALALYPAHKAAAATRTIRLFEGYKIKVLPNYQSLSAVTTSGLVLYYSFDNSTISGSTVTDLSTSGNTGTLSGSPTTGVAGEYNQAVTFGGTSSILTLASTLSLASGTYTITSWFMAPLPNSCSSYCTLTRGGNDHQVLVSPALLLGAYDNAGGTTFHSSGFNVSTLSAGWHHLAAVASASNTVFYIDGVNVGTANFASTDNIVVVGNYQGTGQPFGTIDEVRVYNRALSSTEVTQMYKAGRYPTIIIQQQ